MVFVRTVGGATVLRDVQSSCTSLVFPDAHAGTEASGILRDVIRADASCMRV